MSPPSRPKGSRSRRERCHRPCPTRVVHRRSPELSVAGGQAPVRREMEERVVDRCAPSVGLVDTDRKPNPQPAGGVGQGVGRRGAYDDGLVEQPGVEFGGVVVPRAGPPHPVRVAGNERFGERHEPTPSAAACSARATTVSIVACRSSHTGAACTAAILTVFIVPPDFCDAPSFWRIVATCCRALRVAAPGRFRRRSGWPNAAHTRSRRAETGPERRALNSPSTSPTSSSHQGGELTVVQHYLERRPLAALGRHLLARSASFTRAAPPARHPRKPGPPLR